MNNLQLPEATSVSGQFRKKDKQTRGDTNYFGEGFATRWGGSVRPVSVPPPKGDFWVCIRRKAAAAATVAAPMIMGTVATVTAPTAAIIPPKIAMPVSIFVLESIEAVVI